MIAGIAKRGVKEVLLRCKLTAQLVRGAGGAHIVMLHGVGGNDFPKEDFKRFLSWLKQEFDVVSLDTVVDRISSFDGPISHCCAITFDDGLQNNFDVAYPILNDLNVPATFFVCPGLIDSGSRIWTYEMRYRLLFLEKTRMRDLETLKKFGFRSGDVVNWMKKLYHKQRIEVQEWIESMTSDFDFDEAQDRASKLMTWQEIRSLDPDLITIGSHSLTHPNLDSVSRETAMIEILQSAERLRSELGRPIDYFCFPNGDHSPAILDIVRGAYRAGIATGFGINRPGSDLAKLSRVGVNPRLADMAWNLYCAAS